MNLRNALIVVSASASVIAVFTAYDSQLYYVTTPLFALSLVLVCAGLLDFGTERKAREEIDSLRKQLNSVEQNQRFKSLEDSLDREGEDIRREFYKEIDSIRRDIAESRNDTRRECDEIRADLHRSETRTYDRIDEVVRDFNYATETNHRDAASINA